MVNKVLYSTLLITIILFGTPFSNAQKLGFSDVLRNAPLALTTFCIPNTEANNSALAKEKVTVKYSSSDWLFVTATPTWIDNALKTGIISNFFFEFAPPQLLSDSARMHHFVDQVHIGSGGLQTPFTGKGVVIGIVDTGVDFMHEDFKNDDGSTRVMRYWDHSTNAGPAISQYGYGTVWDSTAINNGTCTSTDNNGHGSTVTGMAAGNARALGYMKGIAPDADIVMVETNFNLPNWTLTIADACDYIFKVADTLGKPAVVNLSLGTYLGSHDGTDPASQAMEAMLDAQAGRIIVAAAGNSGLSGKYHVHTNVTTDTSFVWIKGNPVGAFGPNTIYFDVWSDAVDATFNYGFGADKPSPGFGFRGMSAFHPAMSSLGGVIYDTIWNNGNRIATITSYPDIVGSNYNLQVVFTALDSTAYLYRFMTTNSGEYDLWSGTFIGLNDLVYINLPTIAQEPDIAFYSLPDTLQTIVSAWNCSEKVISVGNMQNRIAHVDGNGNTFSDPVLQTPGKLARRSSKGPSRHNVIKPDIAAAGEISFGAAPGFMTVNPAYYDRLDSGLYHLRNGGTSMSSPLVAGIAALYLEKCNNGTYADFKADMIASAYADQYTGTLPNFGFGYGKIHALNLLLESNYTATISGPNGICEVPIDLGISSTTPIVSVEWSDGSNQLTHANSGIGDYSAITYDARGCIAYTDTHTLIQFAIPTISSLTLLGDTLFANASDTYQWTLNGGDLVGETNSQLTVTSPFGTYTCYTINSDGCLAESNAVTLTVGIETITAEQFSIYPNPVRDIFQISSKSSIIKVELVDANGKIVPLENQKGQGYDVSMLSKGIYTVVITTESGVFQSKITRM